VAEYPSSLVSVACGARQEYPARDPEVFPYGAGATRAVPAAELLERETELRDLETPVTQAAEAGMRCLSARGITGLAGCHRVSLCKLALSGSSPR
jgi:hypothetical protein